MADTQSWADYDFACAQGSTWRRFVRFWQDAGQTIPVDFTGAAVDMHIREGVADSGAAVLAHLSSRGGSDATQRIFFIGVDSAGTPLPETEDETSGMVMLLLSDEETAAITPAKVPKKGLAEVSLIYDIEVTDALGETRRYLAGEFVLNLEVTRI